MLCWALLMFATWQALQSARPGPWWCAAGLALGVGLLAKYTMAAAWLSLVWLVAIKRRRQDLLGLAACSVLALILVSPNLVWNAAHDWPTLRHTAEITVGAAVPSRELSARANALGEYLGGQLLMAGPVLLMLIVFLQRRGIAGRTQITGARTDATTYFALAFALPLLCIGLLQALNARTQMNWTAPALLGICLWVGWRAVATAAPPRWLVVSTIIGVALTSLLATAGDLRRFAPVRSASERPWDAWARMRGWDDALDALRPALASQPDLPLRADSRDLVAHAAYAWRDLPRRVTAVPFDGAPRHHYEMLAGRKPPAAERAWLLLSAQPAAALRVTYPGAVLLADGHGGRVVVRLWLVPTIAAGARSP
jgi:4-amino-4-deoxy-L-arabinose transferase-like glycosyltransferase